MLPLTTQNSSTTTDKSPLSFPPESLPYFTPCTLKRGDPCEYTWQILRFPPPFKNQGKETLLPHLSISERQLTWIISSVTSAQYKQLWS